MRVLIVGVGSIGHRRARLLSRMGHDVGLCDTREPEPHEMAAWYPDIAEALGTSPDATFLCTPPETHVELLHTVLAHGLPVFVEKPLSLTMDGVMSAVETARERGIVTMGACNMRWAYRGLTGPELYFVSKRPLRDWRPGAEGAYREHGIVLESGIHEMDVAVHRLGRIVAAFRTGGRDCCTLNTEHERGTSMIALDWSDDAPVVRGAVCGGGVVAPDTSDEMYVLEMAHFLDCVRQRKPTVNPLHEAAHVLEWAVRLSDVNVAVP